MFFFFLCFIRKVLSFFIDLLCLSNEQSLVVYLGLCQMVKCHCFARIDSLESLAMSCSCIHHYQVAEVREKKNVSISILKWIQELQHFHTCVNGLVFVVNMPANFFAFATPSTSCSMKFMQAMFSCGLSSELVPIINECKILLRPLGKYDSLQNRTEISMQILYITNVCIAKR